jgi:hypothetical protein
VKSEIEMRRPSIFIVLSLILCLVPLTAFGANPKWKIGPEESARYRVSQDKVAAAGTMRLTMPSALPLGPQSFKDGRTYSEKVNSVPNMIFYYTLSIPKKISKKGAPVVDAFTRLLPYSLSIKVIGRVKAKTNGSKLTIEGLVKFEPGAQQGSYKVTSGTLAWTTVFDTKEGCVVTSNFDYQLDMALKTTSMERKYKNIAKGRIILLEKGKRDPDKIRKNIKVAIKKGIAFLKSSAGSRSGTGNMGYESLKLFALLRSGVSPKDPAIQGGLKKLAGMKPTRTYGVSLYIMVLEALTVTRKPPQGKSTLPRYVRGRVGRKNLKHIQTLSNWLVNGRNPGKGTWHYTPVGGKAEGGRVRRANAYDNSNTQFAVLALHAAHRAGAKINPVVWREMFEHFKSVQSPESGRGRHNIGMTGESASARKKKKKNSTKSRGGKGVNTRRGVPYRGWSYSSASTAYGSMTNAGLSSLAIAADMLKDAKRFNGKDAKEFKRMIAEGLHWNASNYSITENPGRGSSSWYYYYMYSLEKACELIGVDSFDSHDWFLEGADYICALQEDAGSWNRTANDTALALLFLNRATLRTTVNILPGRTATGEGADPTARATVLVEKAGGLISLGNLLQNIKQASGSQKSKFQRWFSQGIVKLDETNRPVVMPELLDLMAERKFKSWAKKQLRSITQDSKLSKVEDFNQWYERWEAMDTAASDHAYQRIPLLKQIISSDKNALLRKVAMLVAVRLRAVELVEDIGALISSKKERALALDCLSVLMGDKPADAEAVSAWAVKNLETELAKQAPKRFVAAALAGDAAKKAKVVSGGKTYLEELVALAKDEGYGEEVCGLLAKITGEKLEAAGWSNWWRTNNEKIGKDGKLPKAKKPAVVKPAKPAVVKPAKPAVVKPAKPAKPK